MNPCPGNIEMQYYVNLLDLVWSTNIKEYIWIEYDKEPGNDEFHQVYSLACNIVHCNCANAMYHIYTIKNHPIFLNLTKKMERSGSMLAGSKSCNILCEC